MRSITKINAGWAFSKEAKSVPASYPAEWTQLDLPYTWNGKDGQDGGNDYYRGTCYFAKVLKADELPEECIGSITTPRSTSYRTSGLTPFRNL